MLTSTQISSYIVPKEIWEQGRAGESGVPPLSTPARDALEIERRRSLDINLRNEDHRYTISCERMQSLVVETFKATGSDLLSVVVWPARRNTLSNQHASALAYLITIETLYRALFKSLEKLPYQRFLAIFFPPEDRDQHLKLFQFLVTYPRIDDIMQRASQLSSRTGKDFEVTPEQCKSALTARYNLLQRVQAQNCGLVDVIQLV